jgi:hypothetical protein
MASQPKVKVDDPRAQRVLFDALRQRSRGRTELVKLTRADAVALTGLPNEQAEPALKSLVATYRSHLAVTDDGDLVYAFDPTLERRDQVPLRERLEKVGQVVWSGFKVLFKIWIVVTLIVYVVAFIAMMLALMFGKQGDDRDDRRGGGGGMPWLWFWLMPDLAPPGYHRDMYGRPIQRQKGPTKRFYNSVFDFVFGPKSAPVDPRESDRRLIGFLRDHHGRVTASELSALTGLSLAAAEEEMTRLMVAYDGEVEVAEDGSLLYVFDELLTSAEAAGSRWSWAWAEPDPVPALTGNTSGANAAIGGFAGFNLLASLTIGPAFLERVHLGGDPLATFFVTLFPLMFSTVFFAVPAARWALHKRKLHQRERRQLRRALMREVWAAPATPRDPDELAARAAEATGQPKEAARAALELMLQELEGDVADDAEGRVRYVFPRLDEERRAVQAARAAAPDRKLGEVIFSSEPEDEAKPAAGLRSLAGGRPKPQDGRG